MPDGEKVPFIEFLERHEDGALPHELTDRMRELTQALVRIQRQGFEKVKGRMLITIDMVNTMGQIDVQASVKLKMPVAPRLRARYFPTKEGDLSETNPKQGELFDAAEKPEPKDVGRPLSITA